MRTTLDRGSASLSYTVVGSGPTLIVVPGGPGFGYPYMYESLVRLLGEGRRLVFYDPRGSGASTGHEEPARLTMRSFVRDLRALQDAVGAPRADFLGHSFGGLLGLHYALKNPDRVRSLVLVDPDPARREEWNRFREVLESRRTAEEADRLEELRSHPDWERDPTRLEEYFRVFMTPYFGVRSAASHLHFDFDATSLEKINATSRAVRRDLGQWDILGELPRIKAPTLLLHGASGIFPLPAAEAMHAAMRTCALQILPAVGHFPFLEAPEAFQEVVTGFLRRHSPGGASARAGLANRITIPPGRPSSPR